MTEQKKPSDEVESSAEDVVGTWHITDMEMWGEDYFNMEVQAYIQVEEDGLGDFQFGLVSGGLDGQVEDGGSGPRFRFTWEGRDEMDPVSGGGWLEPKTDEMADGMIKFHRRDRSGFTARRAS